VRALASASLQPKDGGGDQNARATTTLTAPERGSFRAEASSSHSFSPPSLVGIASTGHRTSHLPPRRVCLVQVSINAPVSLKLSRTCFPLRSLRFCTHKAALVGAHVVVVSPPSFSFGQRETLFFFPLWRGGGSPSCPPACLTPPGNGSWGARRWLFPPLRRHRRFAFFALTSLHFTP